MAFQTVTITLGVITINGKKCTQSTVRLVGSNVAVNCIDNTKGIYRVEIDDSLLNGSNTQCLDFEVTCKDCDGNCTKIIKKCLCTDNVSCPDPCTVCVKEDGSDIGHCVPKCPDKCELGVCIDDCIQCVASCPNGKICTPYLKNGKECRKCVCPPTKVDDGFGRCVSCVNPTQCGPCHDCVGNVCVPKDCGVGVCNPLSSICVGCTNSGHCGTNECCSPEFRCECCNGYVRDLNGNCVVKPECVLDGDCSDPCKTCKLGICTPVVCPPGQLCDAGECKQACDCNNPASCGTGKICRNKGGACVCESCGACANGCAEGCIDKCAQGQGCVANPCVGFCTNASQCGPGCGCNPATGKCDNCQTKTCSTNCGSVLGCTCSSNNLCDKTSGGCAGSCSDDFDCGLGCTCLDKKCVSCSYLSCSNGDCAKASRCKCNGAACVANPDAKCSDTLEIVVNDGACTIDGILTVSDSCGCPTMKVKLNNTSVVSGTSSSLYTFNAEIFKGNNTDAANRIDQTGTPGIADNEKALSGAVEIVATVLYTNDDTSIYTASAPISGKGITDDFTLSLPVFLFNYGTAGASKFVKKISFAASISEAIFPNTCEYASVGFSSEDIFSNNAKFEGELLLSSSGIKDPLITWWKSNTGSFTTKLKDKYVSLVNGVAKDTLEAPEAESCFNYKIEADCGCSDAKSKHVVFCSPSSFDVTFSACNTVAVVTIPKPCSANLGKSYDLYVNTGSGYAIEIQGLILVNAITLDPIVKQTPIKSIKLKLTCDTQGICEKVVNAPSVIEVPAPPADNCVDGVPVFTFTGAHIDSVKFGANPFQVLNGSLVYNGVSGQSYDYIVRFKTQCSEFKGTASRVCCANVKPSVTLNCSTGKYTFTGLKTGVLYSLDGINYTKTQADLNNLSIYPTAGNSLYYKLQNGTCSGSIALNPKSVCCEGNWSFDVQPGASNLTVVVTTYNGYTSATGWIVTAGSISQSITNPSGGSVLLATGNGTFNVTVKDNSVATTICPVGSKTGIVVDSCAPVVTLSENACDVQAYTAGTCACKDLTWTPTVSDILYSSRNTIIGWTSRVVYKDALITAGTIKVTSSLSNTTVVNNINQEGFVSGSSEVACQSGNDTLGKLPVYMHHDQDRYDESGANPAIFLGINVPTGTTISSVTFNGTPMQVFNEGVWFIPWTEPEPNFVVVISSPGFDVITWEGKLIHTGNAFSALLDRKSLVYDCAGDRSVKFELMGLTFADGCTYADKTVIIPLPETGLPPSQTYTLLPSNPNGRWMKYTWLEDGKVKKEDYVSNTGSPNKSVYHGYDMDLTKQYSVFSSCTCTSSPVVVNSCLSLPQFQNVRTTDCGDAINFNITGGCYKTVPLTVSYGPDNLNITKLYGEDIINSSIAVSSTITSSGVLYGVYNSRPNCEFSAPIAPEIISVNITKLSCGSNGCTSGQFPVYIKLTKNGVAVPAASFTINNWVGGSPTTELVTGNPLVWIAKCIDEEVTYTFDIVYDGCTYSNNTIFNSCDVACVVTDFTFTINYTGSSGTRYCTTDTASITVNTVQPPGTPNLEYKYDGGAWNTLTIGTPITGLALGASPYNHTLQVKKATDAATCPVLKSLQYSVADCSVTPDPDNPAVNCSLSANKPTSTLSKTPIGGECVVEVNDVLGFSVTGVSGAGGSPYTYYWDAPTGTVATNGLSTASITVNSMPVSGGRPSFGISVTVTGSNGCSRTTTYSVSGQPSCSVGTSPCGTGCNSTCCAPNTCISSGTPRCCATPERTCGTQCCEVGYTCSGGQCILIGSGCNNCQTWNGTACVNTCIFNQSCCPSGTGYSCKTNCVAPAAGYTGCNVWTTYSCGPACTGTITSSNNSCYSTDILAEYNGTFTQIYITATVVRINNNCSYPDLIGLNLQLNDVDVSTTKTGGGTGPVYLSAIVDAPVPGSCSSPYAKVKAVVLWGGLTFACTLDTYTIHCS